MILGGAAGVIGSTRALFKQEEWSPLLVVILSVVLHACTAWVGWGLWQGKGQFVRWAKVLFCMQAFFFNVGGYAYEFWNGVSARISVGGWMTDMPPPSHTLMIGGNFGASFNLHLTPEDSRWMVGVNLVALLVLAYLFWVSRIGRGEVLKEHELPVENGSRSDSTTKAGLIGS